MSAPRHVSESWARKAHECLFTARMAREAAREAPQDRAWLHLKEALYWATWWRYYRGLLAQGAR